MSGIVSSLMQRRVRTIGMDDTVAEVEGLFVRERLSWAPVTDSGQVVGVISATDLLRFHATRQDVASYCQIWCTQVDQAATLRGV